MGGIALGGETFWEEVRNRVQGLQGRNEVPALREIHRKTEAGVIVEKVASFYGVPVDRITRLAHPLHRGTQVAMYLARKKTDLSLNEIGAIFGKRHYTAVSVAFRRVEAKRQRDRGFDRELSKIEKRTFLDGVFPKDTQIVSCQDLTLWVCMLGVYAIKHLQTQIDGGRIHADQFLFKPERFLPNDLDMASFKESKKQFLIKFPGTMLVGISQGGMTRER